MIWFKTWDIKEVIASYGTTMLDTLGIDIYELGNDYVSGKMPVDERHIQPKKMLHGGASVALAESLGSIGANLVLNPETHYAFGLEVNANHVRSVKYGEGIFVYGTAKSLHIGKTTQVWSIKITNEEGKLVCICRLTMAVLEKC